MLLIPLAEGSKSPRKGSSWKGTESDDPKVHEEWLAQGLNVGFPPELNGAVVVDFDDKEKAREFYKIHKNLLGPIVETRKGIHAFFAGTTKTRKLYLDGDKCGDIKGNGYTVFPPSKVDGWTYRFVHEWGPLPEFPEHLFQAKGEVVRKIVSDVRAYLSKIESISGKGGSHGLVRAASRCRDNGLSEAEAMAELEIWNNGPTVNPPWSVEERLRAVMNVYKKGQ